MIPIIYSLRTIQNIYGEKNHSSGCLYKVENGQKEVQKN